MVCSHYVLWEMGEEQKGGGRGICTKEEGGGDGKEGGR